MANPLAKTIMKNISKKALHKQYDSSKNEELKKVNNINEKEEELLKSILNKNNTKINLNSLKNSKLNTNNKGNKVIENNEIKKANQKNKIEMKSLKSLSNKSNNNSVKQIPKDKQNKNMISLKDLAK